MHSLDFSSSGPPSGPRGNTAGRRQHQQRSGEEQQTVEGGGSNSCSTSASPLASPLLLDKDAKCLSSGSTTIGLTSSIGQEDGQATGSGGGAPTKLSSSSNNNNNNRGGGQGKSNPARFLSENTQEDSLTGDGGSGGGGCSAGAEARAVGQGLPYGTEDIIHVQDALLPPFTSSRSGTEQASNEAPGSSISIGQTRTGMYPAQRRRGGGGGGAHGGESNYVTGDRSDSASAQGAGSHGLLQQYPYGPLKTPHQRGQLTHQDNYAVYQRKQQQQQQQQQNQGYVYPAVPGANGGYAMQGATNCVSGPHNSQPQHHQHYQQQQNMYVDPNAATAAAAYYQQYYYPFQQYMNQQQQHQHQQKHHQQDAMMAMTGARGNRQMLYGGGGGGNQTMMQPQSYYGGASLSNNGHHSYSHQQQQQQHQQQQPPQNGGNHHSSHHYQQHPMQQQGNAQGNGNLNPGAGNAYVGSSSSCSGGNAAMLSPQQQQQQQQQPQQQQPPMDTSYYNYYYGANDGNYNSIKNNNSNNNSGSVGYYPQAYPYPLTQQSQQQQPAAYHGHSSSYGTNGSGGRGGGEYQDYAYMAQGGYLSYGPHQQQQEQRSEGPLPPQMSRSNEKRSRQDDNRGRGSTGAPPATTTTSSAEGVSSASAANPSASAVQPRFVVGSTTVKAGKAHQRKAANARGAAAVAASSTTDNSYIEEGGEERCQEATTTTALSSSGPSLKQSSGTAGKESGKGGERRCSATCAAHLPDAASGVDSDLSGDTFQPESYLCEGGGGGFGKRSRHPSTQRMTEHADKEADSEEEGGDELSNAEGEEEDSEEANFNRVAHDDNEGASLPPLPPQQQRQRRCSVNADAATAFTSSSASSSTKGALQSGPLHHSAFLRCSPLLHRVPSPFHNYIYSSMLGPTCNDPPQTQQQHQRQQDHHQLLTSDGAAMSNNSNGGGSGGNEGCSAAIMTPIENTSNSPCLSLSAPGLRQRQQPHCYHHVQQQQQQHSRRRRADTSEELVTFYECHEGDEEEEVEVDAESEQAASGAYGDSAADKRHFNGDGASRVSDGDEDGDGFARKALGTVAAAAAACLPSPLAGSCDISNNSESSLHANHRSNSSSRNLSQGVMSPSSSGVEGLQRHARHMIHHKHHLVPPKPTAVTAGVMTLSSSAGGRGVVGGGPYGTSPTSLSGTGGAAPVLSASLASPIEEGFRRTLPFPPTSPTCGGGGGCRANTAASCHSDPGGGGSSSSPSSQAMLHAGGHSGTLRNSNTASQFPPMPPLSSHQQQQQQQQYSSSVSRSGGKVSSSLQQQSGGPKGGVSNYGGTPHSTSSASGGPRYVQSPQQQQGGNNSNNMMMAMQGYPPPHQRNNSGVSALGGNPHSCGSNMQSPMFMNVPFSSQQQAQQQQQLHISPQPMLQPRLPTFLYEHYTAAQELWVEDMETSMPFGPDYFGNAACLVDAFSPEVSVQSELEIPCEESSAIEIHSSTEEVGSGDSAAAYTNFEGSFFTEPVVSLKSIWDGFDSPFGCTIHLAQPAYLAQMRPPEDKVVYVPLLSGFRIRFHEASSAYKKLECMRHERGQRSRQKCSVSAGAEGNVNVPDPVPGLLTWSASERPDNRNGVSEQLRELAHAVNAGYSLLLSATTADIDHQSWVAIMWQPVFVSGHSAKHSCGSFLAFYMLRPPHHLFLPYASKSHWAELNSSWNVPFFRVDRAAVAFDVWTLRRKYHVAREVPSVEEGYGRDVEDDADAEDNVEARYEDCDSSASTQQRQLQRHSRHLSDGRGRGGVVELSATGNMMMDTNAARYIRIPLVGLVPNRCRSGVWFPSTLSPQQQQQSHTQHMYRAPLFLLASAMQLMCWDAFEEHEHQRQPPRSSSVSNDRHHCNSNSSSRCEESGSAGSDGGGGGGAGRPTLSPLQESLARVVQATLSANDAYRRGGIVPEKGTVAAAAAVSSNADTEKTQQLYSTPEVEKEETAVADRCVESHAETSRNARRTSVCTTTVREMKGDTAKTSTMETDDADDVDADVAASARSSNTSCTAASGTQESGNSAIIIVEDMKSHRSSTNSVGATSVSTSYPYFDEGIAFMTDAAKRYRQLREASTMDYAGAASVPSMMEEGHKEGDDSATNESAPVLVAGGTCTSLLGSRAGVIVGLLDFYQWAQYDTALLDFAKKYCTA